MAPNTVGTLLASNHYVWFGKATAKLKTSRGQGVVTAFIFLSDVKDEIDFEFIGADLGTAQTNYYFQGITDCQCLGLLPMHVDGTNADNRLKIPTGVMHLSTTPLVHTTPMKSTGHRTRLPGPSTVK